jgi:hypothetical protein
LRSRLAATPRWSRIAAALIAVCLLAPAAGFGAIKITGARMGPLPLEDASDVSSTAASTIWLSPAPASCSRVMAASCPAARL